MTLNELKGFLGDLARPWVLWSGAFSASAATIMCAVTPTLEGAAVVGAAWAGVFGIYWGKAREVARVAIATAQANATVETERAKSSPPPAEALKPADPPPDADAPPWERRP